MVHLRNTDDSRFWPGIRLDLHGAKLENFSLDEFKVADVDFRDAEFWGSTHFRAGYFEGKAQFERATFRGSVVFDWPEFTMKAYFSDTQFRGQVEFRQTIFRSSVEFRDATFWDGFFASGMRAFDWPVDFSSSEFLGVAHFGDADFGYAALFDSCVFHDFVQMHRAKCTEVIRMNWAVFDTYIDLGDDNLFELNGAKIRKDTVGLRMSTPPGWNVIVDEPGDYASFWQVGREREGETIKEPDTSAD